MPASITMQPMSQWGVAATDMMLAGAVQYRHGYEHRRRDARQEKTYRACIEDDEEDMDDCMHPFTTSIDVLERFACGAPDGAGESGGGADQEVRPEEDDFEL